MRAELVEGSTIYVTDSSRATTKVDAGSATVTKQQTTIAGDVKVGASTGAPTGSRARGPPEG